jgi:hypothetical protein
VSDVFEGPGSWMASDGKWYAPERHPDPSYRGRFVVEEESARDEPDSSDVEQQELEQIAAAAEFPAVELDTSVSTMQSSTPLSDIHRTASEPPEVVRESIDAEIDDDVAVVEDQIDTAEPGNDVAVEGGASTSSFSVAAPNISPSPQRPVFDIAPPASVVGAPRRSSTEPGEERPNRVELEIARETSAEDRRHATLSAAPLSSPSLGPATPSTSLVVVPPVETNDDESPTVFDRTVAVVIFAAGVAMIVGTFLDWTTGSLIQTGWDRGDGIATVIAGVIGSAAAGPIYVGYRHIIPKSIAIVSGLIGLVVIGLTAISVLFDSESAGTSIGVGFVVVFVGSAAMATAGLADRGEVLE